MSSLPAGAQPGGTPPAVAPPGVAQPDGLQATEDLPTDAREVATAFSGSLVERSEIAWTVAWIAVALCLLGLVSTARIWSASSDDGLSAPPRFSTDINTAPAAELTLLPGIGPELAGRIVAERESSGPFASAEQLQRVRGIGPKTIEQVIPLVICSDPAAPASLAATE